MVPADGDPAGLVERTISSCAALERLIDRSPKFPPPWKLALLRLLRSELRSLSLSPSRAPTSNLPHLHSLLHVLLLPSVSSPSLPRRSPAHASCSFRRRPAWLLVSARNPRHVNWPVLRTRVARIVEAARAAGAALRPEVVVVFLSRGVGDPGVVQGLTAEFGAVEVEVEDVEVEEGWVDLSYVDVRAFEIEVDGRGFTRGDVAFGIGGVECRGSGAGVGLGEEFRAAVEGMMTYVDESGAVNFDTTALVAMVSGISNGCGKAMLEAPEEELRGRFKGNYKFVMDQVHSEILHPILSDLKPAIAGRKGIVCSTVYSEFQELLSMYGGPNEKSRAAYLLKCLVVVPDCQSARISALPTTRKMAMKNKIVFGTGDHWRAPTLTANSGFTRAISQTGMSLLSIEHRPRALIGE